MTGLDAMLFSMLAASKDTWISIWGDHGLLLCQTVVSRRPAALF